MVSLPPFDLGILNLLLKNTMTSSVVIGTRKTRNTTRMSQSEFIGRLPLMNGAEIRSKRQLIHVKMVAGMTVVS
jgi:hypothetical protein